MFSPIFTRFGTRIADIILKVEFVCEIKQNYFASMRGNRISVYSISRLKQHPIVNRHQIWGGDQLVTSFAKLASC